VTEQRPRFSPPEPKYGLEAADARPEPEPAARQGVWSPLTIALSAISAVVVIGLVVTLGLLWGRTTEPLAGEAAAPYGTQGTSGTGPTDTPKATPTPYVVQPGDTVSIDQDAVFEDGFTLTEPKIGDWVESEIINRPDQLTLMSPGYDSQLQVWQTSVFDSSQTDKDLTLAQLNRINDECAYGVSGVGEPESFWLEGEDGTKLELLGVRATNCEGGEIWMLQRVMPLSGFRIHIVLWSIDPIDDNDELLDKLDEISFTTP
jgi:hypothetical protein